MGLPSAFRQQIRAVHVLAPYTVEEGQKVSPSYDTPDYREQLRSWFHALELPWTWHAVSLPDLEAILDGIEDPTRAVFLNLCDGSELDGYPGLSMVQALERRGWAFTGADSAFYELTTCKLRSKALLQAKQVATAPYRTLLDPDRDLASAAAEIGWPLFLKPAISAGSCGLSERSVLRDMASARAQYDALARLRDTGFVMGELFVEAFLEGREFTCLVLGDEAKALPPVERAFTKLLRPDQCFLSYERYWEDYHDEEPLPSGEPLYRYTAVPRATAELVAELSIQAYRALGGRGYARVDLRMDPAGKPWVLEVNSNCGLSDDGQTSVSHILSLSGTPASELLAEILTDGWQRSGRQR